jgi:hypothetical protein
LRAAEDKRKKREKQTSAENSQVNKQDHLVNINKLCEEKPHKPSRNWAVTGILDLNPKFEQTTIATANHTKSFGIFWKVLKASESF